MQNNIPSITSKPQTIQDYISLWKMQSLNWILKLLSSTHSLCKAWTHNVYLCLTFCGEYFVISLGVE